jgi:hypothetical protein
MHTIDMTPNGAVSGALALLGPGWGPALLLIGLALAAGPRAAVAGTKAVDETRSASATGTVEIENVAGSVVVTGWDRNEVTVKGTIDPEATFEFSGAGENTKISIRYPHDFGGLGHRRDRESDLEIQVPRGSSLDVQVVSADATIKDVSGRLDLDCVSGTVSVEGKTAASAGVGKAEDTLQRININSVSGSVTLVASGARAKVESVSGDVACTLDRGEVECSNVSGGTTITGGDLEAADVSAVSGSVEFTGTPVDNGRFSFTSHSGSVTLLLPADVSAEISAETFSGDIMCEFGGNATRTSKYAPGKELELTLGDGGAQIEANSFSGTVELRKK